MSKGRSFPLLPHSYTHIFRHAHIHLLPPTPSATVSDSHPNNVLIQADPRSLPCYTSTIFVAQLFPLYTSSLTIISTTLRYTLYHHRSTLFPRLYNADSQYQPIESFKQRIVQPQNYPSSRYRHIKVENNAEFIHAVDNTAPQLLNDYCE